MVSSNLNETDRKVSAFRPLRVRKAADEVVAVVVDAIRGGLYEPGEKLPRERDLAAALDVSRTVVGQAMGVLERAGIVAIRRGNNGGFFVEKRWVPADVIAAIEGETWANMHSLLEVRRLLETEAALRAGERRTDNDVADLGRLVGMLRELLDDPEEFHAVDVQFHVRVAEASRNEFLADLVREMMKQFLRSLEQYPVGRVDLTRALRNQEDTFQAIVGREPAAIATAINEHLATAEEYFLGERLTGLRPSVIAEG